MKNKTLWWITGIVASVFSIILIVLGIGNKIKLGGVIIWIVVIILIGVSIDIIFYFFKQKSKITLEKEGSKVKIITSDDAREMARKMLLNKQFSEYERELLYENIVGAGALNTPIYVRMCIGEFEGKNYGIWINMEDSVRKGIKEYAATKSIEEIHKDINKEVNLSSSKPIPDTQYRQTDTLDPITGLPVASTRTPIQPPNKPTDGELI